VTDRALRLAIVITSVLGFGVLGFGMYKLAANADKDQRLAESHLGPGTVCDSTLRCTRGGHLFLCAAHGERVGCAKGAVPLPEEVP